MGKRDFKDYICRPFCMFFRENEKEAMACWAAQVVERLVKRGRLKLATLPREGKDPHLWERDDQALDAHVCEHCSFISEGCDFRSKSPPYGCEPCGGYILLCLLKEKGIITSDHLEEVWGE